MKKEKKRLTSYKEISIRIVTLALCLWLGMSGVLTWAVASDVEIQIQDELLDYVGSYSHKRTQMTQYKEVPGAEYTSMVAQTTNSYWLIGIGQTLPIMLKQKPNSMSSDDWFWGKWDMIYGFEAYTRFCADEDGQNVTLLDSGNYLTFTYTAQTESGEETRMGYVDMDQVEGGVSVFTPIVNVENRDPQNSYASFSPQIYMVGYFEGNQFFPHIVTWRSSMPLGSDWQNVLSVEPPSDREICEVQGECVNCTTVDYEKFFLSGKVYSGLPEYVEELEKDPKERVLFREGNLWNTILVAARKTIQDEYGTFDLVVAVRCWPLSYTMLRLIPFYVVSLVPVVVVIVLILRRIREKLTRPLELMVAAVEAGVPAIPSAQWKEPRALQQYIRDSHQERARLNNEIQRLNTALAYAKDAEENRRQLVSHLTHELKTPLAVIHSYAEGLQEGIAADKMDQYLSVILDESEKMDGMVLQMLELSRLEAGKVKLSVESFSPVELTKSIAETFAPLVKGKNQELIVEASQDFHIYADETRIGQAITNLISNANKYTPIGGKIRIKIYMARENVYFTIENTSAHLTEEAMGKVWDSFYRVDPARTEPGTGLGLTLVKSIVELHRGVCTVRNTMDKSVTPPVESVEFGFILPCK